MPRAAAFVLVNEYRAPNDSPFSLGPAYLIALLTRKQTAALGAVAVFSAEVGLILTSALIPPPGSSVPFLHLDTLAALHYKLSVNDRSIN